MKYTSTINISASKIIHKSVNYIISLGFRAMMEIRKKTRHQKLNKFTAKTSKVILKVTFVYLKQK